MSGIGQMHGVVVWRCKNGQRAVIWCDDHKDLAYWRRGDHGLCHDPRPGDVVAFDLGTSRRFRLAHNLQVLEKGGFARLASRLRAVASTVANAPDHAPGSAQVVQLFGGPDAKARD